MCASLFLHAHNIKKKKEKQTVCETLMPPQPWYLSLTLANDLDLDITRYLSMRCTFIPNYVPCNLFSLGVGGKC